MITISGQIISMSWANALYQDGDQYVLATHQDFECTIVINAWSLDPLIVPKVKEELEAAQSDRHVPWPVIEKIKKLDLSQPEIHEIAFGGRYSVFPHQ